MLRNPLLVSFVLLISPVMSLAQKEYGFDNRKASGQPYLNAEETVKRMKVPPGYEVKLFAAEPDVINPIAFTIDEKGRVWVVECYEYPKRTPPGKMPRDRIKILEDTNGDGKCDKVTVWAEGKDFPVRFDLASGIEVGHGGVFLGAAPYLWFLKDTDNDGKCDKYEILLKGFGSQDTHETLNTLQWGPDGRLYGLHGIFTQSEVSPGPGEPGVLTPGETDDKSKQKSQRPGLKGKDSEKETVSPGVNTPGSPESVKMNGAVWRYDVRTKKFEIFAEGTSNPWGMDFDQNGQCFLSCCVIPHLFHVIPGGIYIRQAGTSYNPYAYGYLKEICDHTHHKESGWAHAGLLIMQGKHVPEEYQNSVLMGSIHGCSIKRDVLRKNGSTFIASHAPDFLTSGDKNFRPINLRWGPNNDIYVIDWHDQNNCHQSHPDSWDMKHGRVYRIQRTGKKNTPAEDVTKKADMELASAFLEQSNPWRSRTALRLLSERRSEDEEDVFGSFLISAAKKNDPRSLWGLHAAEARLTTIARSAKKLDQVGMIYAGLASPLATLRAKDANSAFRIWSIRFFSEARKIDQSDFNTFLASTGKFETAPEARLELASAAYRLRPQTDIVPLLHDLMLHKEDATDPAIPLMLWYAYEPKLAAEPKRALEWLTKNAAGNPLITDHIIPRVTRRLAATDKPEDLALCVKFIGDVQDKEVRRQALSGLATELKARHVEAPPNWEKLHEQLANDADPGIKQLAGGLAVRFRDTKAVAKALKTLQDAAKPKAERLEAIQSVAVAHPENGLQPLLDIVKKEKDEDLRRSAAVALGKFNKPEIPSAVLANWKDYPPSVRVELLNVLKSQRLWGYELLTAVGNGQVPKTDVTNNVIMALHSYRNPHINELIEKVWGKVRTTPPPAELDGLISQMRAQIAKGKGHAERGKHVFEKNCMQCHKFEGKGHDVGPNLDGAERSVDYLLINVLDPNRVIGQPYFQRVVLLKNGKLITGLLAEENANSVTLRRENNTLEVIRRADIEEMRIEEKSLMPEGLANNMTADEFTDLVRYLMAKPKR